MKIINKILYEEAKSNIWRLTIIIMLAFLIVAFEAVGPWPFKILIDNVLQSSPLSIGTNLNFILALFNSRELLGFFAIFIYFLSTFLLTITEYLHSDSLKRFVKNITVNFSKKAFDNLQDLKIGFYRTQEIGDYIYRLSYDTAALGELFEQGLLPLLTSGLYLIVTTVILFLINVKLTLISLAILPFLALGLYFFNKYIASATKKSEYYNSTVFSFIEEVLTHLNIIQAFLQKKRESQLFKEKIELSLKTDTFLYRLGFLLSLLVGIIIAVSYSLVISYGINLVFIGELTTGLLIVFILYLDNLTNPLLNVIYAASSFKESYIKISRMNDFFSERRKIDYRKGLTMLAKDNEIKFENVSVKTNEGSYILKNVSLQIEPGKRTVILGASGSGKTSILSLIMRFIEKPHTGKLTIGGIKIQKYNIGALRENIAFVPQEITLFNDTVYNNIAFGNLNAKPHDVYEAARLAVADGFIKNLPGGYDFTVGEGGIYLSGGQRQRIMLARAFMKKNSKIVLFDEVLSALDIKTRSEIIENIYNFSANKTTVIVSNIFSIVHEADNIIVVDNGRILYSGKASFLPKENELLKLLTEK